jgi:hypothetical protein
MILRARGLHKDELSVFIEDTIHEMQQLDLSNPKMLKEYMTRKMDEIDGEPTET